MSLVLDCSVSLAWYFEDESSDAADDVLERVRKEGAVVPGIWHFEIANALQMAVRRKRIDGSFRDRALGSLRALAINVDPDAVGHAWDAGIELADRHGLSVYDAAYLELALRRRLNLATLDRALIQAGEAEGVPVIGI